jgi:hypothetical protein
MAEAMLELRCSRPYLSKHAEQIGCVRRGGRVYFFRSDLDAWNDRHYTAPSVAVETVKRAPVALRTDRINPLTKRPYGSLG